MLFSRHILSGQSIQNEHRHGFYLRFAQVIEADHRPDEEAFMTALKAKSQRKATDRADGDRTPLSGRSQGAKD